MLSVSFWRRLSVFPRAIPNDNGTRVRKCQRQHAGCGRHPRCRRRGLLAALTTAFPTAYCSRARISTILRCCGAVDSIGFSHLYVVRKLEDSLVNFMRHGRNKRCSQTFFMPNKMHWSPHCGSNFPCFEEQISKILLVTTLESSR